MYSSEKWLKQAKADLEAAKDSLNSAHYEWACFQAQQCAEKALKAFLYDKGYVSLVTHSILELIKEASKFEKEFKELESLATYLDLVYIPSRYPNGLPGNFAPVEFYRREDAERCVSYAESILKKVEKFLKK